SPVYRAEPPDEWRDPVPVGSRRSDEILVHIAPVLLGDGVRLHEHPGGTNIKLERISLTESPQVTNLWLRVVSRDMPHRLTRGR
ncbi:MAG TPA: hypothetical protein VHW42_09000, partial [Actinomycetes bacterium]|nr:hypothetical protein [Actinomycetes bacterium]